MSIWAIAYDLDVKGMKAAGYTKSNVTKFYNSVRKTLQDNHFEKLKQWSIYTSSQENSLTDAFEVALALKTVVDADKFVKRLHLFRIEDFNDLLPLIVPGKTSDDGDAIEQEINEVFSEVAAVASWVRRHYSYYNEKRWKRVNTITVIIKWWLKGAYMGA